MFLRNQLKTWWHNSQQEHLHQIDKNNLNIKLIYSNEMMQVKKIWYSLHFRDGIGDGEKWLLLLRTMTLCLHLKAKE